MKHNPYASHKQTFPFEWQLKMAVFLCTPLLVLIAFLCFHIFILPPEITTIKFNRITYPSVNSFFFISWNTQPLISDKCVQMPLSFPQSAKNPLFALAGLCMPLAKVNPIPCTHKYPVGRSRGCALPSSLTPLMQTWPDCGSHPAKPASDLAQSRTGAGCSLNGPVVPFEGVMTVQLNVRKPHYISLILPASGNATWAMQTSVSSQSGAGEDSRPAALAFGR